MRKIDERCELLVPAGGPDQFIAAVENGADAIYVGGTLFNARMNAGNFSDEELKAAVAFAHKRGVKVHVTVNILIKDEELEEAVSYCAYLYEIGVDALIIQDIGLASLLKEVIPGMPLHMSTQNSINDVRAVNEAAELGFERVVLARELSAPEIRYICRHTDTEIEVFIHGALCVCYSGQCQLSRFNGGKSGNRGLCAQPCRLPYQTFDDDDGLMSGDAPGKYPLSTKDLCLLEDLGSLIDAGVKSFKVEGRMKSPEYVGEVTRIYRKYIDEYYSEHGMSVTGSDAAKLPIAKGARDSDIYPSELPVTASDLDALRQIFSRGGFTEGYYKGVKGQDLMSGSVPKHQGIYIGKVVKQLGRGRGELVDVKLTGPLDMGDGIEIHSDTLVGNIVTYYEKLSGGLVRIGDIRGHVEPGDEVYRTSSKAQLDAMKRTFTNKDFHTGKYLRKSPVDFRLSYVAPEIVTGFDGQNSFGSLELKVESQLGPYASASLELEEAPQAFDDQDARIRSFDKIRAGLMKTGGTPFEAAYIEIDPSIDFKIKASQINYLRREALEMLASSFDRGEDTPERAGFDRAGAEREGRALLESLNDDTSAVSDGNDRTARLYFYTIGDARLFFRNDKFHDAVKAIPGEVRLMFPMAELAELYERAKRVNKEAPDDYLRHMAGRLIREEDPDEFLAKGFDRIRVMPYISNISKGTEDSIIEDHFKTCLALAEPSGVAIGSLTWLDSFRENGAALYGDFGLNVYNRAAAKAYADRGARPFTSSLETMGTDNGAVPLMTTEHIMKGAKLVNERYGAYRLKRRAYSDQTLLLRTASDREILSGLRRLSQSDNGGVLFISPYK